MKRDRWIAALVVGAMFSLPVTAADPPRQEELHYRWRLTGVSGLLAGLFFPRHGTAVIATEPGPGEGVTTTLELTSPRREGDYYRYGAEIGVEGSARRVWKTYHYRGDSASDEETVDGDKVLDFASTIRWLRRTRPTEPRTIELWSSPESSYPLSVTPVEERRLEIDGRVWQTRHYLIKGLPRDEGDRWKGKFHLFIADDEHATVVRLRGERGVLALQLDLSEIIRGGGSGASARLRREARRDQAP